MSAVKPVVPTTGVWIGGGRRDSNPEKSRGDGGSTPTKGSTGSGSWLAATRIKSGGFDK